MSGGRVFLLAFPSELSVKVRSSFEEYSSTMDQLKLVFTEVYFFLHYDDFIFGF